MSDEIKEAILKVRATGKTNMLDLKAVQKIAFDLDLYDLVIWLDEHKKEYAEFILYGD